MDFLDFDKLQDYFYDRCSPEEELLIQQWFASNGDTEQAHRLLAELFDTLSVEDPQAARRGFSKFCRKIGYTPAKRRHSRPKWLVWTQRAAAVLFIPALVAALFFARKGDAQQEWLEVSVPYGEMREVVLPDSTRVWMNSGSRLTYPGKFGRKSRHIFAEGEIFADVARDGKVPFIVSAGEMDIRVLGTKFNLRAYRNDSSIEVALVEGAVQVDTHTQGRDQQIIMRRGDVIYYDKGTGNIEKHGFAPEDYRSFAEGGGLRFYNKPFAEIAAHLERCFNLKIVILDEALAREQYFAYFKSDDSVTQILKTLNADNTMHIYSRDGIIFIEKKK